MSLSSVVLDMALYGFLGAFTTQTMGFPFVVMTLLWFYNTTIAVYRNEPVSETDSTAALIVRLNFTTAAAFVPAAFLGLLFAFVFQFAPLVRWELWHVPRFKMRNNPVWVSQGRFSYFALGGCAAVIGFNFLACRFVPEVSAETSLLIGFVLMLLGLLTVVKVTWSWYSSPNPSENLDGLMAYAIAFLAATPVAYDFLLGIRPFQHIAFHLVLILGCFSSAWFHYTFFRNLTPEKNALIKSDVRADPSQSSARRIFWRWFTTWLVLAILYIVGGIVDELTVTNDSASGDVESVAIVVFFAIAFLFVVGVISGGCRWWSPFYSEWSTAPDEVVGDDTPTDTRKKPVVQTGNLFDFLRTA